ncbi:MAG: SpoIIE family protein phosphatase [Crocinitomicaceae bacterium]
MLNNTRNNTGRFKFNHLLLFICIAIPAFSFSQSDSEVVSTQSDEALLILSDSLWLFKEGDEQKFGDADYNDSDWDTTVSYLFPDAKDLPSLDGIVWFRKHFTVPLAYRNTVVAVTMNQAGASELYLDGKLIRKNGNPSNDPEKEEVYNPNMTPIPIYLDSSASHVIALRYSNLNDPAFTSGRNGAGFRMVVGDYDALTKELIDSRLTATVVLMFLGTFFLTLAFLHLIIYLFYRKKRNNLFYALFMFSSAAFCYIPQFAMNSNDPSYSSFLISFLKFVVPFFMMSFLSLLYALFYKKMPKIFWVFLSIVVLTIVLLFAQSEVGVILSILFSLGVYIESFRVSVVAIRRKKRGAWIVGGGVLFLLLTIFGFILSAIIAGNNIQVSSSTALGIVLILLLVLAVLSLPFSMSVFLAWDISKTNVELEKKLVEVKELSEKTIRQEQEKKKIIEGQKEKLEIEVKERTKEIVEQKEKIEEAHQEIKDSIAYAKRIQTAILPPDSYVEERLPENFVFYKPKDVVAGDFYWVEPITKVSGSKGANKTNSLPFGKREGDIVLFAAADCTGHGVPGAMISVICNNALNRAVREFNLTDPAKVLDKTREIVLKEFEKSEEEVNDGMDIALCSLSFDSNSNGVVGTSTPLSARLKYAGAHNPLWIIRKGSDEIEEIKASKQPIGKFKYAEPFVSHEINLSSGDSIYIFSDGFSDQFGGEKGKKYKAKNFKKLLLSVKDKPMSEQKELIDQEFEAWKGNLEQLDDVCVIGVRM